MEVWPRALWGGAVASAVRARARQLLRYGIIDAQAKLMSRIRVVAVVTVLAVGRSVHCMATPHIACCTALFLC
jgi:hypothetical protein